MCFKLECIKNKRTGFFPAFFWGGILAAAVPLLNMTVRAENYLRLDASPIQILMDANWQIMAMLNVLLAVAGACLMYQTEHADGSLQRMCALPIKESRLFFGKAALLFIMCAVVLMIEAAGIACCVSHWFKLSADVWVEIMKSFSRALLLMLPAASGSLLIASACKNMWVSLGIGIVCVFTATMVPSKNFYLSLFPFALPFQTPTGTAEHAIRSFLIAAVLEIAVIATIEVLFLKIRRWFA